MLLDDKSPMVNPRTGQDRSGFLCRDDQPPLMQPWRPKATVVQPKYQKVPLNTSKKQKTNKTKLLTTHQWWHTTPVTYCIVVIIFATTTIFHHNYKKKYYFEIKIYILITYPYKLKKKLPIKLGCHNCIHVNWNLLIHFGFPPFWSITKNMIVTTTYILPFSRTYIHLLYVIVTKRQ